MNLRQFFSPEQRRVIGAEAKQLLDNRHLREAFEAVREYLDAQSLGCDPDNKDKTQRIVISRQLLAAIEREIVRKIEDGEVAQVEMSELDRRSILTMFRR